MGIGFGGGGGHSDKNGKTISDRGNEGGGGGMALCKPVTSEEISNNGVTILPVFDFTKITIAAITTFGSTIIFWRRFLEKHYKSKIR